MANFPLSSSKKVRDILFLSGQIGIKDGRLVSDEVGGQLAQIVENISVLLVKEGSSLPDVIDVTAFLIKQEDYEKFNEAYATLFLQPYPTRTTVTVKSLPANALVELKIIAHIPTE